jgi:hypothetical protein
MSTIIFRMNSHFPITSIPHTMLIFSFITVPTATAIAAAHAAKFGTLVAFSTYSRVEGEFTVLTHVTLARGVEGGPHGHGEGEDHADRRGLSHIWTDNKWENPTCDRVISG